MAPGEILLAKGEGKNKIFSSLSWVFGYSHKTIDMPFVLLL